MSPTKITVTGVGEAMKTAWQKVNTFMDGAAASGANADITSMTGLDDDGIPYAAVYGAGNLYFPDYNETDQGLTGSGKSAKAYIDTISTNSATLVFRHNSGAATTTYTFSTDETIPSNINVVIEKGAILSIASTKTLTINGSFEAGLYQVFSGAGDISGLLSSYPEWFGAVRDGGTDDGPAFRKARSSTIGNMYLSSGTYLISGEGLHNTGIVLDDGEGIIGASSGSTILNAGGNGVVVIRASGNYCQVRNISIRNSNAYAGTVGLALAAVDDTLHEEVCFGIFENLQVVGHTEGIMIYPSSTVDGNDPDFFYNVFQNIEIRGCVRGLWLREPPTQPGSGANRNNFYSLKIGNWGTSNANTGIQIDAGNTNKFFGVSFESISNFTSPNAVPTGLKVAYNSPTFDATHNKFYGVIWETCTRDVENVNDLTEFYGCDYDPTKVLFTRAPYIDVGAHNVHFGRTVVATPDIKSHSTFTIDNVGVSTRRSTISSTAGQSSVYNGMWLQANSNNADLESWVVDIGGLDRATYPETRDKISFLRKAAGGTYTPVFTIGATSVGSIELAINVPSTTIINAAVTASSKIFLFPTSVHSAAEATTNYISSVSAGQFIVTHANNGNGGRTYNFLIIN